MYGGISEIVKPLSADVAARLAALSPPIVLNGTGGILLSRAHVYEQGAPNRIVMIPVKAVFGARDVSSSSNVVGAPSSEMLQEWIQHAVASERVSLLCQCWGQANPPDPDFADFDVTQVLYRTVVVAARKLVSGGRVRFTDGVWSGQVSEGSQYGVAGHVFEFGVEFDTPITEPAATYAVNPVPAITPFYQAPGMTPAAP